jgi:hypothetical protein
MFSKAEVLVSSVSVLKLKVKMGLGDHEDDDDSNIFWLWGCILGFARQVLYHLDYHPSHRLKQHEFVHICD